MPNLADHDRLGHSSDNPSAWTWRVRVAQPPHAPCSRSIVAGCLVLYFVRHFGGWLLVLLTALFWVWSGMASLGVGYLIFIAPIITAILAWRLRQSRTVSAYHRNAFLASIAYTGLICVGWLVLPLFRL